MVDQSTNAKEKANITSRFVTYIYLFKNIIQLLNCFQGSVKQQETMHKSIIKYVL